MPVKGSGGNGLALTIYGPPGKVQWRYGPLPISGSSVDLKKSNFSATTDIFDELIHIMKSFVNDIHVEGAILPATSGSSVESPANKRRRLHIEVEDISDAEREEEEEEKEESREQPQEPQSQQSASVVDGGNETPKRGFFECMYPYVYS